MKKVLSRIMCFIICASLIFCIAAPPATVEAASSSSLPVIYIKGRRTPIYNKKGEKIYPMTTTLSSVIDENMSTIVSKAVKSYTTGNWNYLGDTLYDLIAPLYKEQKLNKNGEISNGTYIKPQASPKKNKSGSYKMEDYVFDYDSRIDPWESAALLRKYVSKVLSATGKKKVRIVGRCMGSDILAAYLVRYKSDPKVDTSVFYAPGCNGILIVGAPFSGKIEFDTDALERYAKSSSKNEDDEFSGMLKTFYNLFGKLGMKLGADIANDIYQKAAPSILPRLLIATYATMPGYWAMVGDEFYEDALVNVFGKKCRSGSYKKLIEKTDRYHYKVQQKLPSVLNSLKKNGMRINVISKYNVDFDPIYAGCNQQGDGWIEAKNSSFGATVANMDSKLSSSYVKKVTNSGCANYISGDRIIDASTGAFPDYTWYIRNMPHTTWSSCVNSLIYAFFSGSKQVTVKTNSSYPQFLKYSGGKLVKISNYQQVLNPTLGNVSLSKTTYVYDGKTKTPKVIVKDTANKLLKKGTDYTVTSPKSRKAIGTYTVTVKFKGKYNGKAARKCTFKIIPANVKLNSSLSGRNVTLSWGKVAGATKYRLYIYDFNTGNFKKVLDTTSTSYKRKNLTPGGTYIYAVKAFKTVSGKSYFSASYGKNTFYLMPLAPTIKVSAGVKYAKLSWAKVNGGAQYEIFRGNSKNGIYRRVGTTTSNSYKDTGLWSRKTYYYKVRAIKISGDKKFYGSFSDVRSVKVN